MKENETLNNNVGGGTAESLAAPENVISSEDRERLDNLFERIGDHSIDYAYTEYERKLKAELQREGTIGARYLLEKISQEENSWPLFELIQKLQICATPEILPNIGTLLLEDKLTQDRDGSNIMNLVSIFKKIGTSKEVHFLSEVVHKTATARGGRLIDCDTLQAFGALREILERTEDEDKAVVREAMNDINAFRKENGLEELTETPSYSFGGYNSNYHHTPINESSFDSIREENSVERERWEANESDISSDNEIDEIFGNEYFDENRMLSAVERLEIVKKLRISARREKDPDADPEEPDDFLRKHYLEYKEKNPSPYGVTLGIEIEIPEKTVLPKELVKNYGYGEVYKKRQKYYEKFQEAEKIGVPNGHDLFWEFAHQPARNPLTIAREVQALVGMGLINKKYAKYPLHVTLGGITSSGDEGTGAYLLSHALEATAWSTNADRLTRPYRTEGGSWTQRGGSGLRQRDGGVIDDMKTSDEQDIGNTGVEFRTLQLQSLSGLDRHLHSVYYLGTALRAFQEREQKGDDNPIRGELKDVWVEFSKKCSELFAEIGLSEPPEDWKIIRSFDDNHDYDKGNSSFKELAKILDEGTTDPNGEPAKFIHDIRLLIIQTRTKVREILEKEKPILKE
jgi:hypothetical protein